VGFWGAKELSKIGGIWVRPMEGKELREVSDGQGAPVKLRLKKGVLRGECTKPGTTGWGTTRGKSQGVVGK